MNIIVIVLAYNGASYLRECLSSLANLPTGFRVLVVDNGSADDSLAIARSFEPAVAVVANGANLGFSGGMNRGMRLALGTEQAAGIELAPADAVVLLNQDTRVLAGWAEAIVAPLADPAVAAVGCKLLADDERTIIHVGGVVERPRATTHHLGAGEIDAGQYHELIEAEYATGAALALRASALREVGLLDERFNPAYMEEVDLCARLRRAGYRVVVNPLAAAVHHEGSSTRAELQRSHWFNRGRLLYLLKHAELAELLGAFAEAERTHIESLGTAVLVRAEQRAYLDALVRLNDWYIARRATRGEPATRAEHSQLAHLLASLHELHTHQIHTLFRLL